MKTASPLRLVVVALSTRLLARQTRRPRVSTRAVPASQGC
jgi:hypothetical protein